MSSFLLYRDNILFSYQSNHKLRFLILSPIIIFLLFLLLTSLLVPYFETRMMVGYYEFFNGFLKKICHQYPSRCFYIFGSNVGLCVRCFSIYTAILIFTIFYVYWEFKLKLISRFIFASILAIPIMADGITQYAHLRISTNFLRFVTGTMSGFAVSIVLIPLYMNIMIKFFNNLTSIMNRKEGKVMFKATNKIIMLSIVFGLGFFVPLQTSLAKEILIKAGTPVQIRLEQSVSSQTATAGQSLRFKVIRDVEVDNIVVIKAGSMVVGEVTFAQKTGSLGKEGKLYIVVRHAVAVDGTKVPLRANLSKEGDEKVALSWMICPFIKGSASRIDQGTEAKAFVDYNTKITIE